MPELSIAGESLLFDYDHKSLDFFRNFQPLQDLLVQVNQSIASGSSRDTSVGESQTGLPRPNYPVPPPPRINQMYWPTGAARWAQGYFLASSTVAAKLIQACGSAVSFIASVNDITLTAEVYVLPPRPVSSVAGSIHDSLFLIPIVDERYWWQFKNFGNMGKPSVTTWDALFTHIAGRLGISLTVDPFSSSYIKPDPEEFTRRYDNAATLLDAVAHSVGQRIVRQFDGTVRSMNWSSSKTEYEANLANRIPWWQIAGDSVVNKPIPSSVQVVFPRADCGVPSCSRQAYISTVSSGTYTTHCVVSGTIKTIHSSAWANFQPDGLVPINVAELDSLAEAIAADYYVSLERHYDHTFIGVKQWYFTAYDDHALLSCGIEDDEGNVEADTKIYACDGGYDATTEIFTRYDRNYITRIQSSPLNFGVDQMLQQGSVTARIPAGLLAMELNSGQCLQPGGNAQASYLEWITGASDWSVASESCAATVYDPFYRNFVLPGERFWVRRGCDSGHLEIVGENGLMRRGKPPAAIECGASGFVLIYANNPEATACVPPPAVCSVVACNTWGCGRKVELGSEVIVKFFERVWQILPGGAASLIRFEMKSALSLGGSGTAIEVGTGPAFTPIGEEFPIKDPWVSPGMWRYDPNSEGSESLRGYMGWCLIPSDPEIQSGQPVREIVWMEQIARSINFTLSADMSSGAGGLSATAEIDTYYLQGKDPATSDLVDGSEITVYDPQRNYPRALTEAKGKARYNDRLHRYEIIECNQMAIMLNATASSFCPSATSVSLSGHAAMTPPPYGQRPETVSAALNRYRLASEGGPIFSVWDESVEDWVAIMPTHQSEYFSKEVDFSSTGCTMKVELLREEIAYMGCGNEDTDDDTLVLTQMDVVTNYSLSHTAGSGGAGSAGPTAGSCAINITKQSICALPGSGGTNVDVHTLSSILVMQDVFQDGCDVKGTVVMGYVHCVDSPDEVTLFSVEEVPVVTGFETQQPGSADFNCKIIANTKNIGVLCSEDGDDITVAEFSPVPVLEDVWVDGVCIKGNVSLLYVLCNDGPEEVSLACGTDCASSGS